MTKKRVMELIIKERERQDQLRKAGKHPWSMNSIDVDDRRKLVVLAEEFGEVAMAVCKQTQTVDGCKEGDDVHKQLEEIEENLTEELVQVAACCVAWLESRQESR